MGVLYFVANGLIIILFYILMIHQYPHQRRKRRKSQVYLHSERRLLNMYDNSFDRTIRTPKFKWKTNRPNRSCQCIYVLNSTDGKHKVCKHVIENMMVKNWTQIDDNDVKNDLELVYESMSVGWLSMIWYHTNSHYWKWYIIDTTFCFEIVLMGFYLAML